MKKLVFTVVKGTSTDLKNNRINNPDASYTNIFSTVFVSYKMNGKNMVTVSYSKTINRPDYQTLNPFETIYYIYTAEKHNSYLKPPYTNNLELKYTYRYALNVALGYNQTRDYRQTITSQTGQQTLVTTANIGTLANAHISISAPLPITKRWDGYANITFFLNITKVFYQMVF